MVTYSLLHSDGIMSLYNLLNHFAAAYINALQAVNHIAIVNSVLGRYRYPYIVASNIPNIIRRKTSRAPASPGEKQNFQIRLHSRSPKKNRERDTCLPFREQFLSDSRVSSRSISNVVRPRRENPARGERGTLTERRCVAIYVGA